MAANDGTITFRVTRQNQTIQLNTAIPANADVSLKSVHVNRVPLPAIPEHRSLYCGNVAAAISGGQVDPYSSVRVIFDSAMFGTAKMIHENGHPEGFSVPLNDGASTTYIPDGFDLLRATEQETKFFQVKTSYMTPTSGLLQATGERMKDAYAGASWRERVDAYISNGGMFYADAAAAGVLPYDPTLSPDETVSMNYAYGMIYSIEFTFAYATSRTLN
jgi:hypothetical protein